MAIRQTRKISELNTLTSASLNTYVLGVDNGATYKITLDVLEDAVVNMVSRSTDLRLDALESYTSSANAASDISALNSFTSSQTTLNSAFTSGINARLQTSSFNEFSASVHNEIVAATNEQDLSAYVTQLVVNTLSSSVDNRIDNLEANSGSYLTSLNGAISSSSQLTSSYDSRYVLSGSITQTTWDNIANKPDGIVSQSVDIADFTFTEQTITNGAITLEATNSDIVLDADGAVYIGSSNAGNQIITDGYLSGVIGDTEMVNNGTGNTITDNLTNIINSIPTIPDGTISGSEQITALGFISSSQTLDTGSLATTGSNTFNGNQTINGSLTINFSNGMPTGVTNWNGQGGWNQGFYSNLATTGGTGTGLTVDVAAGGGGYIGIEQITINTAGSGYTNGDIITIDNENNLPGTFTIEVGATSFELDASGGLVFPDTTTQTTAFNSTLYVNTSSFNSYTASISTASIITSISNLNSATASYLTSLSGAISSSAQINALGFISSSDSTTALNLYTASLKNAIELTGSTVSFLGNIVIYGTQSVINSQNVEISDNILYLSPTASTDNDLGIVGHYNDGTYRHAGIFMDASDGHSWKVFNGLQTETTATVDTSGTGFTLAPFKAGVITGTSFNGIVNATNGVISGSSQLTSSFDERYTLSGSVSAVPSGTISGSAQITALGFVSSSTTINTGSFVTTSSFNAFTASALTTGSNTFSGSQIISGALYVTSITSISSSFSLPSGSSLLILSGSNIYVDSSGSITGSLSGSIFGIGDVVAFSSSVNSRLNSAGGVAGTISGSAQITAFGFVSGSYETTGRSIVSGSSQLTSSFDSRYTLSGSVSAVPSGTISGSAQITAFGFVSASGAIPSGTISGSSQLTASFDLRYLVTGSVTSSINALNTFSASENTKATTLGTYTSSLNIWTSSVATTGSNSFNGAQTITGSLTVSSIAVVSTSVTLPSGSVLSLTSGSNLVIQNNGIAEITGSLKVSGSTISLISTVLQVGTGSGDEGGEILLVKSQTNNSLTGSGVTIDSFQNRLRIFEQGGNARGVHIDLTKAPDGVNGELIWKASGMVNAGTFVTLDNIKVTITTTGSRGLSVATVSGTVSGYISGQYQLLSGSPYGASSSTSLSTTATSSLFGWNFVSEGDMATYILRDNTNNRVYRITMIIGAAYNSNFISIERLY